MVLRLKNIVAVFSITILSLSTSSCTTEEAFSWDSAEVSNGLLIPNDADHLSYAIGFIDKEKDGELKVDIHWAGADTSHQQQLVREVSGGAASVKMIGGYTTLKNASVLVEWPAPQAKVKQEALIRRCWRLDVTVNRFAKIECPPTPIH